MIKLILSLEFLMSVHVRIIHFLLNLSARHLDKIIRCDNSTEMNQIIIRSINMKKIFRIGQMQIHLIYEISESINVIIFQKGEVVSSEKFVRFHSYFEESTSTARRTFQLIALFFSIKNVK